jgi:ATP-binding cassette subfamily B protein
MRHATYTPTASAAPPPPGDSKATGPKKRDLRPLRALLPYLAPYKKEILWAGVALVLASGTVLSMGVALKSVVDRGFATGDVNHLNQSLIALLLLIVVLSCATFARFSLVAWIGERLIADLRENVWTPVEA